MMGTSEQNSDLSKFEGGLGSDNQWSSFPIGVMRGCKGDQPRNLAKSVTVE